MASDDAVFTVSDTEEDTESNTDVEIITDVDDTEDETEHSMSAPRMMNMDNDSRDDFIEVFSPSRIVPHVRRRGMRASISMDIKYGNNFLMFEDRVAAFATIATRKPLMVSICPPCTMYSPLQRMWNLPHMSEETKTERFKESDTLLEFAMVLAKVQYQGGRFFVFEHPERASSWKNKKVEVVASWPLVRKVTFDQCRVGLQAPISKRPMRKRTTLMTNSVHIYNEFKDLKCMCADSHAVVQGAEYGISLATHAAIYPPRMCDMIAGAVEAHVMDQ